MVTGIFQKADIFIICFMFMLYEVLFLLYMSDLCDMSYYVFIIYLHVSYMFLKFVIHFYFNII